MKLELSVGRMSRNSKYFLLLLCSVLLFALMLLYILQPLRNAVQENNRELTKRQQRLAAYQTFAFQHKDYADFTNKQKEELLAAEKALPDAIIVSDLIQEYSNLMRVSGIQFKSVASPDSSLKEVDGVYAIPLKFTIGGNYYKIVDFLKKVENGDRFTILNQVSIVADENGKNEGDLKMSADFTAFSLKNSLKI